MSSAGLFDEDTGHAVSLLLGRPIHTLATWSGPVLILSASMLAAAPLFVTGSYSAIEHTLSESGAQGVEGAWVVRAGVVFTAGAVAVMTVSAPWSAVARRWLRIYVLALIMLTVFPEAPVDGSAHNETVAWLHTVFAVVGATSFILGVVAVSVSRPGHDIRARAFDWVVIAAVALIPQIMMLGRVDGLLQRLMVALGYFWLLSESARIGRPVRGPL